MAVEGLDSLVINSEHGQFVQHHLLEVSGQTINVLRNVLRDKQTKKILDDKIAQF